VAVRQDPHERAVDEHARHALRGLLQRELGTLGEEPLDDLLVLLGLEAARAVDDPPARADEVGGLEQQLELAARLGREQLPRMQARQILDVLADALPRREVELPPGVDPPPQRAGLELWDSGP